MDILMSSVNSPGFLIRAIFVFNVKKYTIQKTTIITHVAKQKVTPAFNPTAAITKHSSTPINPIYHVENVIVISMESRVKWIISLLKPIVRQWHMVKKLYANHTKNVPFACIFLHPLHKNIWNTVGCRNVQVVLKKLTFYNTNATFIPSHMKRKGNKKFKKNNTPSSFILTLKHNKILETI